MTLYQQIYTKLIDQADDSKSYIDYEVLFVKSVMWLHAISKKSTITVEKKSEEELLVEVLEDEFEKLTKSILEYIYVSIPFMEPTAFQKTRFY